MSVMAKRDCVVRDVAMGIDRKLFAGQLVPPDLRVAYERAFRAEVKPDTARSFVKEITDDEVVKAVPAAEARRRGRVAPE